MTPEKQESVLEKPAPTAPDACATDSHVFPERSSNETPPAWVTNFSRTNFVLTPANVSALNSLVWDIEGKNGWHPFSQLGPQLGPLGVLLKNDYQHNIE